MTISRNIEDFNDITASLDLADIQKTLYPTAEYIYLFFKYTQNINQYRYILYCKTNPLGDLKIFSHTK